MTIRLSKSTITEEDKNAVLRVLDGEYLGMGVEVQAFEKDIQQFIGGPLEVVCLNSGTAALHLALQACSIGPGDEVLVPSLTYIASFQAISATGATPVACDIKETTLFIDTLDAENRITPNTKAIMPVHYASDSQHIPEVYDFARRHDLRVIEDAAHSFGCKRDGKIIGNEGDILCFSFDGIKNITCGEGGAVVTSDLKVLQILRDTRLLGVERDTEKRFSGQRSWEFDVKHQGWRYHMSNVSAALGKDQLKRIEQIKQTRQQIALRYMENLSSIKQLRFLQLDYPHIIPHIFVIKVIDGRRDALKEFLLGNDIETGVHYLPNHLLSKYKTAYSLPMTEKCFYEILTLPCHLDLNRELQNLVIQKIKDFFNA